MNRNIPELTKRLQDINKKLQAQQKAQQAKPIEKKPIEKKPIRPELQAQVDRIKSGIRESGSKAKKYDNLLIRTKISQREHQIENVVGNRLYKTPEKQAKRKEYLRNKIDSLKSQLN